MDATVVCIDQSKKSVQVEPRAAWFPRGTRPSVTLSGQRDWRCLLGAMTEVGDRFFSLFEEYVIASCKIFHFSIMKSVRRRLARGAGWSTVFPGVGPHGPGGP
jgi:hypothetical protein